MYITTLDLFKDILLTVSLSILITSCTDRGTIVRRHVNYDKIIHGETILILPISPSVKIVDIAGNQSQKKDNEKYLQDLVQKVLQGELKIHSIDSKILSHKDLVSLGLTKDYENLIDKNEEIISYLYFSKKQDRNIAFNTSISFCSDLQNFVTKTGCNILVAIDYNKVIQTGGARMRNFLLSLINTLDGGKTMAESGDLSIISISFIDARTGDFLWSNLQIDKNDAHKFMENTKHDLQKLKNLVRRVLSSINI